MTEPERESLRRLHSSGNYALKFSSSGSALGTPVNFGRRSDPLQSLRPFGSARQFGSVHRRSSEADTANSKIASGKLLAELKVDIASAKGDAKHFVHKLPPKKLHVKRGILKKLCVDNSWQERNMILTASYLAFSRVDTDIMLEAIPLRDIKRVSRTDIESDANSWMKVRRHSTNEAPPGLEHAGLHADLEEKMDSLSEERDKYTHGFEIETEDDGISSGRVYYLLTDSDFEVTSWLKQIRSLSKADKELFSRAARLKGMQEAIRNFYDHWVTQTVVAVIITASFFVSAVEAQILPGSDSELQRQFEICDLAFTLIFTVELVVNVVGHWMWPFLNDGWNALDCFVVIMSLLALGALPADFYPTSLRLIRLLRVLKLFHILDSLRRIVNALTSSIIPVLNAMVVTMVVTSIYCVIGVQLYGEKTREDFGTFAKAFFTMLQVTTFDNWGEVARKLFAEDGSLLVSPVLFFGTYILVVAWTLLPVVIAVLMENFTRATRKEEMKVWEKLKVKKFGPIASNPLDPLFTALAHFNSSAEQDKRIIALYEILAMDHKAGLSFDTMAEGLKKLNVHPRIVLSKEDFDAITEAGALCNEEGLLGHFEFYHMMRAQFKEYLYRQISHESEIASHQSTSAYLTLKSLKMIMMTLDDMLAAQRASKVDRGTVENEDKDAARLYSPPEGSFSDRFGGEDGRGRAEQAAVMEKLCGIERTLDWMVENQQTLSHKVGSVEHQVAALVRSDTETKRDRAQDKSDKQVRSFRELLVQDGLDDDGLVDRTEHTSSAQPEPVVPDLLGPSLFSEAPSGSSRAQPEPNQRSDEAAAQTSSQPAAASSPKASWPFKPRRVSPSLAQTRQDRAARPVGVVGFADDMAHGDAIQDPVREPDRPDIADSSSPALESKGSGSSVTVTRTGIARFGIGGAELLPSADPSGEGDSGKQELSGQATKMKQDLMDNARAKQENREPLARGKIGQALRSNGIGVPASNGDGSSADEAAGRGHVSVGGQTPESESSRSKDVAALLAKVTALERALTPRSQAARATHRASPDDDRGVGWRGAQEEATLGFVSAVQSHSHSNKQSPDASPFRALGSTRAGPGADRSLETWRSALGLSGGSSVGSSPKPAASGRRESKGTLVAHC